jgi:hypothetical protein
MARCVKCGKEISFRSYLSLGGQFKCNHCGRPLSKRVSTELAIVLFGCLFGNAMGWTVLLAVAKYYPGVLRNFNLRLCIYWSAGVTSALLSAWVIWHKFIKDY